MSTISPDLIPETYHQGDTEWAWTAVSSTLLLIWGSIIECCASRGRVQPGTSIFGRWNEYLSIAVWSLVTVNEKDLFERKVKVGGMMSQQIKT